MKRILFFTSQLFIFTCLYSQEVKFIEELYQSVIENQEGTDIESFANQLEYLLSNPLNLNYANENQLRESQLFTAYQVYGIIKFREKYGAFFSIYELAAIPGFDQNYLTQIENLLSVEEEDRLPTRSRFRGMALANISMKLPLSKVYLQADSLSDVYAGNPVKEQFRMKQQFSNRISAGLAWEKDPGEKGLTLKKPEHLTACLEYRSEGILDHLIIGNFRVQQGLGVVQGMGMQTGQPASRIQGMCRSYARPYASCMEYSYYRGIYGKVKNGPWSYNAYFSLTPVDISLFNPENDKSLFERIRETGLHRTMNEIQGSALAGKLSSMLGMSYESSRWNTGFSLHHTLIKLNKTGRDSVPGIKSFENSNNNLSLYGLYFSNRYEIYCEMAIDQQYHFALYTGGSFLLSPALSVHFNARRYAPGFLSQQSTSYSAGSDPENEAGINIAAEIAPAKNALIRIWSDIYRDILSQPGPANNYSSAKFSCSFSLNPSRKLELALRYQIKQTDTNREAERPSWIQTYRLKSDYRLNENLKIAGRLELKQVNAQTGTLYYQELVYKWKSVSMKYRYLIFNTPSYETRIYCYEPGVLYSFKFPAFQGKGTRNLLVITSNLGSRYTFRTSIGYTSYYHKHETGTGMDARSGNKTFEIEVQLQIKL